MSRPVDSRSVEKRAARVDSVLGAGTVITGDICFAGELRIDGEVRGNVRERKGHSGTLVVGAAGSVDGGIEVARLIVNGQVTGRIVADESLMLQSNARVHCDIDYGSVEIQPGAIVHGHLLQRVESLQTPELELAVNT